MSTDSNNTPIQVVLVDDQQRELDGITSIVKWEELNMRLAHATTSAQDALEYIRANRGIGVVIMDFMDQDGITLIHEIRRVDPLIKVICISCFDDFKFVSNAINGGAYGYLLKPILPGELKKLLERASAETASQSPASKGQPPTLLSVCDAMDRGDEAPFRADIFAKYGWEEAATPEEFYGLCKAIKEETGLIPMTGNWGCVDEIASGFGLSYSLVVDEDGQAQSYLRNPGMKEYLTYMNKLYNEGLIDIDWPVNTGDTINQKMASGQAVMTRLWHWSPTSWYNALVESAPDAEFSNILPLADTDGNRIIAITDGVENVFSMPATISDERADLVMQMIEARLTKDTYWLMNDGIEGTHYTIGEDGLPVPIQPAFEQDMNYGNSFQIGRNQFEHPTTWSARVQKNPVQFAVFSDMNTKAAQYPLTPDLFKFAAYDAQAQYSAALTKKCNDYFIAVIAGTESLDSYDDFVASWEAAGGLELEAGATEWYAANEGLVDAARNSESPYTDMFGYQLAK